MSRKRKSSVLDDINAPAGPPFTAVYLPAAKAEQPALPPPSSGDPVLSAIQTLMGKFDSLEDRLNKIENGVPLSGGGQKTEQFVEQPVQHNGTPARKIYNTPKPAAPGVPAGNFSGNDIPVKAEETSVRYVPKASPARTEIRKTVIMQHFDNKALGVSEEQMRLIEAESNAFLESVGLSRVSVRPTGGAAASERTNKRVTVVCTVCGRECGKGSEWITTDILQGSKRYVCKNCLTRG